MEIDTTSTRFYSQLDEDHLFEWAAKLDCIVSDTKGIFVVDPTKVTEQSFRELTALLMRYGLPMQQLRELASEKNFEWFEANGTYWHTRVFGDA